ncbi:TIGR01777 family oxidoreductase [Oceanobacillus rekensis]|uniref:TIGR01777 family oxidoreductase n=1 Tax=Oceanobacillus rekensis TaxID=937927 RepID=UPI000B43A44E|nr:TIGR01777 family oxidoreductase [Oceanobacillus rekensis]
MNFLISGGTGFVGNNLTKSLQSKGHHIFILTRTPDKHTNKDGMTYINYDYPVCELPVIEGVINLAGESLFGYWSSKKKENIINSRLETTNQVIQLIKDMKIKPNVFISGSAIGYYGTSEDLIFTEATTQAGKDFLAEVTVKWEESAKLAETLGVRTVYARFGIILGNEGSLPLMSLPVNMFAGGKIGNGEQWMSWIHIDDAVNLLEYCLSHPSIDGIVNFTAPNPKRNKDFMKILAKSLKRPYWFRTPSTLLDATIGEMGQLITKGQYVLPKKALDQGFKFTYPILEDALKNMKE